MIIHRFVLCGLLIIGLLALFSLWPAIASDFVIDESGSISDPTNACRHAIGHAAHAGASRARVQIQIMAKDSSATLHPAGWECLLPGGNR